MKVGLQLKQLKGKMVDVELTVGLARVFENPGTRPDPTNFTRPDNTFLKPEPARVFSKPAGTRVQFFDDELFVCFEFWRRSKAYASFKTVRFRRKQNKKTLLAVAWRVRERNHGKNKR